MRKLIILFVILFFLMGCGSSQKEEVVITGQTYQLTYDYIPESVLLAKGLAMEVQSETTVYPHPVYPKFLVAEDKERWIDHPNGYSFYRDYDFGFNSISYWWYGGLYIYAPGCLDAAFSFYDWGVSWNFYVPGDDIQYNVRHNCYLDSTELRYHYEGNYYIITLPTLKWDHILEPIPIGG